MKLVKLTDRSQINDCLLGTKSVVDAVNLPILIDQKKFRQSFTQQLQSSVKLCFNTEFGHQFQQRCKIPGISAEEYQNRAFLDQHGQLWIAGIRFRNLDLKSPFIALTAPFFDGEPSAEEQVCFAEVLKDFGAFNVHRIQFLTLGNWQLREPALAGVWNLDKTLVCGTIGEVAKTTFTSEVSLRKPCDESYLARYNQAFDALLSERPFLANLLAREDEASFQESAEDGLLFEVMVDNQWAGLIAVEKDELWGQTGFLIREEILAAWTRGRGLGPQLQSALALELLKSNESSTLLHGTIHADNSPSLKTALRSSRKAIARYVFWSPF